MLDEEIGVPEFSLDWVTGEIHLINPPWPRWIMVDMEALHYGRMPMPERVLPGVRASDPVLYVPTSAAMNELVNAAGQRFIVIWTADEAAVYRVHAYHARVDRAILEFEHLDPPDGPVRIPGAGEAALTP